MSPATLYTDNDASCVNGTSTDTDGDSVTYTWQWYVDGLVVSGATSTLLTSGNFTKNQNVICEATPSDGIVSGSAVNSTGKLVQNSPPQVPTGLSPVNATTVGAAPQNVTMSWTTGTDADSGDTLTNYWEWYDTDSTYTSLNSSDSGVGLTAKNQTDLTNATYYWRVLTSDGTVNSTWVEYNFILS
jgi:hypothetical protein